MVDCTNGNFIAFYCHRCADRLNLGPYVPRRVVCTDGRVRAKPKRYRIFRSYADPNRADETIRTGVTLAEAQKHCKDPLTRQEGVWFDGYAEER